MRIASFDTECYPNYWLLKFRPRGSGTRTFALVGSAQFTPAQVSEIRALFDSHTSVSFNGRGYDQWMIAAALNGCDPSMLKQLNDKIIVERIKPWELDIPRWEPADHIDVMEVAPGAGSQKQYAGRIHCRTMRDLPYSPDSELSPLQIVEVSQYCENDLDVLDALFDELHPQIKQREILGKRYGIDLRSKSDAQVAEAVLKYRCEIAVGRRIYKPEIDWDMRFCYRVPEFIRFELPQLQHALDLVRKAEFRLGASGTVTMPDALEGLCIPIGGSTYKVGIGGLHSQEKRIAHVADDVWSLRDNDVASYYPSLILNSGEWPKALGPLFLKEYESIKDERLAAKKKQGQLEKAGVKSGDEYEDAKVGNEGGKIMINGTFGKTGSPYSILFAPTMLIQTTVTGQLSLLMLIEWHERAGISVISANTDGIVVKCRKDQIAISEMLIAGWQMRTGLVMETAEYAAIYSRDVNNYIAVKKGGGVKRKGEYSTAGLVEKKNPDCEICADAVALFLEKGVAISDTIRACRDIRKFVTVVRVTGGGVKMWGDGPRKDDKVRDMIPVIQADGWVKVGRKWEKNGVQADASTAYANCFAPQREEYLGKVVRWYYGTQSPGPIVYASNGNIVSMSYGAKPCMTLPDEFPDDVDYDWYINRSNGMLEDIGYVPSR